jgi:hypothetical protein
MRLANVNEMLDGDGDCLHGHVALAEFRKSQAPGQGTPSFVPIHSLAARVWTLLAGRQGILFIRIHYFL